MVQTINGERGEAFKPIKERWGTPFQLIEEITGEEVVVKDDLQYNSNKWVNYTTAVNSHPIQRRLTNFECVMDFDDIDFDFKDFLITYLESKELKFVAWDSSPRGLHVHFWSNITGKVNKKKLVEFLSRQIFEDIGVECDLLPMGHGFVRAELSIHPEKKYQKLLRFSNIDEIFINDFGESIYSTINSGTDEIKNVKPKNKIMGSGQKHGCIKYIESNRFTDGRKRLMFCLISYYKESFPEDEAIKKVKKWTELQGMKININILNAMFRSNTGQVGCNYRHQILDELGHSYKC